MKEKGQIFGAALPGNDAPGREDIFEYLWQKYSARVYNFIRSIVFDKSSAEDLTQEVFMKVWEKRKEIDLDGNFEGYIFTIARNVVYKETRRMLTNASYVDFTRQGLAEADYSTQDAIDASSEHKHLIEIISQMPPSRKNIYMLNKIHGLSIKDISERLGLSARTVENQLYKAKTFIKSKFPVSVFVFMWIYMLYGKF